MPPYLVVVQAVLLAFVFFEQKHLPLKKTEEVTLTAGLLVRYGIFCHEHRVTEDITKKESNVFPLYERKKTLNILKIVHRSNFRCGGKETTW